MIVNNLIEMYRGISNERVLVLVNTSVDALCAWKILQSMLHIDSVQYTLVPVDGQTQLENAFQTHSEQNSVVLLLDCGGNLNLMESLEPSEECHIYVVDSHIPYDLDNVYDGGNIRVVVPENCELEVPRYEDIFEEESDDENSEPNTKRRKENEKDDEEEDSLLPKKERWKRKREELLYTYYELSGCSSSVAMLMFELSWKLSKDNNEFLWWGIVGISDQFLNQKISRDQYVTAFSNAQNHVQRLSSLNSTSSINEMKIRYNNELRLELYRHWTIMDSLKQSQYTASRFRIWTSKGKKKLNEFLADMGLPLLQCTQTFDSMDMEIRRDVCNWIEVTSQKYGLDDITYSSFELQYGFRNKFCAGDIVNSVFAFLSSPELDTEAAFLKAQDTLNRTKKDFMEDGIEESKRLWVSLLAQVEAFIDMKQVIYAGPFMYAVMQEGSAQLGSLCNPARLLKLCRYLSEAYSATTRKAATLPFIVACPLHLDPEYSYVVGVPPLTLESKKSYLGRAFQQAASKVSATIEFDYFNPNVMQIKSEDKAKFFDALTALLVT